MTERSVDKMIGFLAKKVDHHVFEMDEDGQPLARKIAHRSKAEAFKEALDELERQMTVAEEEPETITVQVKSLKDERMKPEIPEVVAAFIERMRDYYITPRFHEIPENEAAVLAYHAIKFLFADERKSKITEALVDKVKTWLADRNNFFVLIDAMRHGYVAKEQLYAIRLTEEVAKWVKRGDEESRYFKVRKEEKEGAKQSYFGTKGDYNDCYQWTFTETEKDQWLQRMRYVPLEVVRVDEVE